MDCVYGFRMEFGRISMQSLWVWQGWAPERQREFLHALPASIATEATVQLLLQSSHKWTYSSPIPVAGVPPLCHSCPLFLPR